MPRLRHGATPNIAEIEATLAILSDAQQSPVISQLVEAITVEAQTEAAQPVATLNLVEALNLQRFGFMLPNDDANLLPVTPQTPGFLIALGQSMLDPGPTAPDNPGDANVPAAYTYFGQFIDHDVTLETSSAGAEELLVSGLKPFDPEVIALLIANIRTGALDLDSVYGNPQRRDAADPNKLRIGTVTSCAPFCGVRPTHPDGVTEKDDFNDVDREPPHPIPSHDRAALIGDPRNDENLIVSQLHLAFLRAHNAFVDEQNLSFAEAKASLRRHYQFLVIHDFLKRVADPAIVDDVLQNGSPTLTNGELLYPPASKGNTDEFFMPLEYAVAAYRFGHSMIRARYNFNVNFPTATLDLLFTFTALSGQLGGGGIPEFDTLPENWIIQWERLIDETTGNKARRIDTKLVDPLFELKNLKGEVLAPADVARLAVRNLLRGYLLRIPTGQAAATALGITPLTPAQITAAAANAAQAQILQDAGFLTKTPLWFYILAEASAPTAIGGGNGNHLGAVGSTIVASVLIGAARRSDDSFLDEGAFPPGSEFEPTMPTSGATFKLADLLTFAGVFGVTAAACLYTVVAGDSLSGIAERLYGDPTQWPRIFQANQDQLSDPDVISPGQVLRIPATGQHTVGGGDSLSGIAQQFYGDFSLWPRIFAANRDQLSDPDVISPGQVLCIP